MTHIIKASQQIACEDYGYTRDELLCERKFAQLVEARWMAMYACRVLGKLSWPQIGSAFNRDHATVMHGVSATRRRTEANAGYMWTVNDFVDRVQARAEQLRAETEPTFASPYKRARDEQKEAGA